MWANSHGPASKRLEKIYAAHLEDAWFRAAFYTKDTLTEEKARCQLLHVELPIENLTPEVEAPNSFLLITSSKDVRELLLEVALSQAADSFTFREVPPPDSSRPGLSWSPRGVVCWETKMTEAEGGEVVPCRLEFPDVMEYKIFKRTMEAALLDVRSVPRHFDLLRRLKGVAQQVAARQNGLPKRARKGGRGKGGRKRVDSDDDDDDDFPTCNGHNGDGGLRRKRGFQRDLHVEVGDHTCCVCRSRRGNRAHPSVPVNGSGSRMLVCAECRELVYKRRYRAHWKGKLCDAGDKHELICAVCSRSSFPVDVTFVMCDECPFSFCELCLEHFIDEDERDRIERDEEDSWYCPCCRHNVPKVNPESKSSEHVDGHSLVWLQSWTPRFASEGGFEDMEVDHDDNRSDDGSGRGSDDDGSSSGREDDEDDRLMMTTPGGGHLSDSEIPELPPVDASKDHIDFFAQYLKYLKELPMPNKVTENSCFLCKDGGPLLECDHHLQDKTLRCKKVYHEYCLGFKVSTDPNVKWTCPRHLCMTCADKKVKYLCRYCPNSACAEHKPRFAHIIDNDTKPRELSTLPDCREMVCPECVRLVIRARYRQELRHDLCPVVDKIHQNYTKDLGVSFHPVIEGQGRHEMSPPWKAPNRTKAKAAAMSGGAAV